MALIESTTFDAAAGVASDLDTMIETAAGAPVSELLRAAGGATGQLSLMHRILELADRDFDPRYQNPADTAITVYLWALSTVRPSLAEAVATTVLGLRNGWWAPRMARRVLAADRAAAPVSDAVWVSLTQPSTTVRLGTPPSDESTVYSLGLGSQLREARSLADGSAVVPWSFDNLTFSCDLVGLAPAVETGDHADAMANDNLAMAA
ncbi:MAG TPA: hypothetical protein VMT70_17600 [Vicinamibacteria bacterium]|nr:hypothetical protein [Vicinamibacteria bacterium]